MIITTPHKYKNINTDLISLKIDNDKIEIAAEVKYLGFILDNHARLRPSGPPPRRRNGGGEKGTRDGT